MAPIKFEENIREKLEERSLQPSLDAWQNLEHKLNAESKKRHKNKFWWFGIAATIIGVLLVFQQAIKINKTNSNDTPIIVNSGVDTIKNIIESPVVLEQVQNVIKETPVSNKMPKLKVISATVANTVNNQITHKPSVKASVIVKDEKIKESLKPIEEPKDIVIASVSNIKDISTKNIAETVTSPTSDSEIDALLNAANEELQFNKDKIVNTIAVDANTLLEDAETEMPPSLKGQLFKVIEKNFNTAKTAVATRNE